MKIAKNDTILDVTKGAYEAFFQPNGWNIFAGDEIPSCQEFMAPQPDIEQKLRQQQNPDNADVPFSEIMQPREPSLSDTLESMTKDELIEYARQNGIVTDGASKKSQIISIIRSAMEE